MEKVPRISNAYSFSMLGEITLLLAVYSLVLKSVRVHFASGEIAITLELPGPFIVFLDKNDRHSLGVSLIY